MLDFNHLTTDLLRQAVAHVYSNPTFLERVRAMQQTVREAGGYKRAADAIIEFSHTHQLAR